METRTTTHYTALWVFYMSVSATTLLAQCDTIKYAEKSKSPRDHRGIENYLNVDQPLETSQPSLESISLSPQTSPYDIPPLYCVYPPVSPRAPPPGSHYGPKPSPPKLRPGRPSRSPPPKHDRPKFAVWCVAKPTVPGPVIQEAMDYACGWGADCRPIQPNGPCFQPNTALAHASYAFNSYFQRAKLAGGTCDFGGTAMLVTDDPSFDGCIFLFT